MRWIECHSGVSSHLPSIGTKSGCFCFLLAPTGSALSHAHSSLAKVTCLQPCPSNTPPSSPSLKELPKRHCVYLTALPQCHLLLQLSCLFNALPSAYCLPPSFSSEGNPIHPVKFSTSTASSTHPPLSCVWDFFSVLARPLLLHHSTHHLGLSVWGF